MSNPDAVRRGDRLGAVAELFVVHHRRLNPNDEPQMGALEKPGASPARGRLWHQRVQQYVDAVQAGSTR